MILKAFSIFDTKTEAHSKPFFAITTGEAIRTFSDAVGDQNSALNKHPHDYVLFEIGTYDDATGILASNVPTNLGLASEYLKSDPLPLFPHAKEA